MEEYLGHHDHLCCRWIFTYGDHVKSMVYPNVQQLKEKIIIAFATLKLQNNTLENVRGNLMRGAQLCTQQRGYSNNFQTGKKIGEK